MFAKLVSLFSGRRQVPPTTPPLMRPEDAFLLAEMSPTPANMDALRQAIAPRDLGPEIVEAGDPNHHHMWESAPWEEKYGPDIDGFDPAPPSGATISLAKATYKDMYACACGAKGIKSVRALI